MRVHGKSAAGCVSRREFLAGCAAAAAILATGCSAGGATKNDIAAKWSFERDDDLNILCMEVAGGSVVAATGDGWAPCDGFIQLQLGGGSIPGTQIKGVTSEKDGARLTVTLESEGVSTRDLVWSEWRLTPPAGIDVTSVSELSVDYGDGKAVTLDRLLTWDDTDAADADPNGRPVV